MKCEDLYSASPGLSQTSQALQLFGISCALHRDARRGSLDLTDVVSSKLNCGCAEVLLETRKLRRSGNWNNPRLLRQQPGKRDLRRRRILPPSDFVQQIH